MVTKNLFLALAILSLTSLSAAQVNINCIFFDTGADYTCLIIGVIVTDIENQNFIIGGDHVPGRTNANVVRLEIQSSTTPFVITQFFTTFVNLSFLRIMGANLNRIQTNAFLNAGNLQRLEVTGNPINTLPAATFNGASNLRHLLVIDNQIATINENAFNGLVNLEELQLSGNLISALPVNTFNTLSRLTTVHINNNQIANLPGRIFANNILLQNIFIQNNQINAIGPALLNNLNSILFLNFFDNVCVNQQFWNNGQVIPITTINPALQVCFSNSVEVPDVGETRRFTLEVRGSLTLRYENGTLIGQI